MQTLEKLPVHWATVDEPATRRDFSIEDKFSFNTQQNHIKTQTVMDKLNAFKRRAATIKKTPAAPPAHQAFATAMPSGKTGDPETDRLAQMLG